MPKIKIYISRTDNKYNEIFQYPGETLLKALRRSGYALTYPCGGGGSCGKCRFRIVQGKAALTPEEKRLLTKEELDCGVRLLCRASFFSDGEILLTDTGEGEISTPGVRQAPVEAASENLRGGTHFDVAADIGTTTIALSLVDGASKKSLAVVAKNNSQRVFGADVLSRIKAANEGCAEALKRLIWQDITAGMDELLEKYSGTCQVDRLVIAANTTMQHLLAGDSCMGLGAAPFCPVSLELRVKYAREMWEEMPERYAKTEVTLLPGISAFVGADIVAGIYSRNLHQARRPTLFVDLGTNGEMALAAGGELIAASAAAGPALEGGNISCGVAGIAGAVCSVSSMGRRMVVRTIGNKRPIGLCGTGVLETAYEAVKTGAADETGTFRGGYLEYGFPVTETDGGLIRFTQEDMRQIQMAKAAIRAGIELLKQEKGLVSSDIEKIYLAGGFGCKLNVYKAAGIGLIPHELKEKTEAVGNTSLLGAIRYLADKEGADVVRKIAEGARVVNLAAHPDFEERYYTYMNFNG